MAFLTEVPGPGDPREALFRGDDPAVVKRREEEKKKAQRAQRAVLQDMRRVDVNEPVRMSGSDGWGPWGAVSLTSHGNALEVARGPLPRPLCPHTTTPCVESILHQVGGACVQPLVLTRLCRRHTFSVKVIGGDRSASCPPPTTLPCFTPAPCDPHRGSHRSRTMHTCPSRPVLRPGSGSQTRVGP
jgi:hypothetical protein